VDSWTRQLEQTLDDAIEHARARELQLVLALEDWGRGGPLGIDQWLGLGAARGHWERAARLRAAEADSPIRRTKPWVRIPQSRWRSMMVESWGHHEGTEWVPNAAADWGRASLASLREIDPEMDTTSDDAAEAGLIALYAMRCDEVGKVLLKRVLRAAGFSAP
jgi:hypothetical protein